MSKIVSSYSDLYEEDTKQRAERERRKKETEQRNELFQLVFSITLAIWLIAVFFFYKYKNRQSGGEQSFRSWLSNFAEIKNFWILIFCVVSLVTCVIYVPYNLVRPSNPDIAIKSAHATIFDIPKDFKPQFTKIDYQAIVFREVLILLGCCVGYLGSTMIKKK